jgi:serine/threonine protein kinase
MSLAAVATGDGDALPRRFGPYVLFDKVAEGGMARIFLARGKTALGGNRLVVVKEILPLLAASAEMSRLLVDEAKLCAGLSHKNIVQVIDLGREEGSLYIAMEYVEGLDLRELLRGCSKKQVPLPIEFSLFVVGETLRALDYAHRKRSDDGSALGIVHRDVSPSNVLLSVEGEVKLCDFGIARALTTGDALPEEAIQGKAGYMSPEAARGEGVDARSDVFAVGIVLWELLGGQRLYRAGAGRPTPLEQARKAEIPPLPAKSFPEFERLSAIVQRALAPDPSHRYPSAAAMLDDLDSYVVDNRLGASALRFGDWLVEHFGSEIIELRRERETSARELDEASGTREAPPVGTRGEQPTLPDPLSGNALPPEAFRDEAHPEHEHRRPSTLIIALLVLLCLFAGALAALFVGRR